MRIVSLVPSTTETLFDLGVGGHVVGRTGFCVHPPEAATVPQVGGTKTPDLERIAALRPDLILTNAEENRAEYMARLVRLAPVASFAPRRVEHALADLVTLGGLVGRWAAGAAFAAEGRAALADLQAQAGLFRFAYLIWREPWMAVGADTFISDVLAQAGGVNVYADAATRYPTLTPGDLFARAPDLIFLPDEPFPFAARHADALAALSPAPAVWRRRLQLVDGSLFSWHGVRLLAGLRHLQSFDWQTALGDKH